MDKKALFKISYGLYVLACLDGDRPTGCVVNTVCQITDSPLRLSVAVNKLNYTCEVVKRTGKFCVSVLDQTTTFDTIKRFGFQSGKDNDKFAGFSYKQTDSGLPYLEHEANAYLECSVISSQDMGSHMLFIVEVTDAAVLNSEESLTYSDYHKHVKPQPKPAAPPKTKSVWRCEVCGFEAEFPTEEMPADYVCPLCGAKPERFVPVRGPMAEPAAPAAQTESSVAPKGMKKWRCKICGFEAEFADGILPDDYICPVCGLGADSFEPVAVQESGAKTKVIWRCVICGFEYEGEELPPDYICPLCKHGADDFERIEVPA